METPNGRFLGRKPDSHDHKDKLFRHANPKAMHVAWPQAVDLSHPLLPALDQGELGSCELNAASKLMQFLYPGFEASRLQLYYDVREIEGTVNEDSGCETRDVFKVLKDKGAIPESEWPYDVGNYTVQESTDYHDAKRINSYWRINSAAEALTCLASGYPFILGFECPKSFDGDEVAKTGVLRSPMFAEPTIGGHGVLVLGYDLDFRNSQVFKDSGVSSDEMTDHALLILNSWGEWGLKGLFYMALRYAVDNTGNDMWTARI